MRRIFILATLALIALPASASAGCGLFGGGGCGLFGGNGLFGRRV